MGNGGATHPQPFHGEVLTVVVRTVRLNELANDPGMGGVVYYVLLSPSRFVVIGQNVGASTHEDASLAFNHYSHDLSYFDVFLGSVGGCPWPVPGAAPPPLLVPP